MERFGIELMRVFGYLVAVMWGASLTTMLMNN